MAGTSTSTRSGSSSRRNSISSVEVAPSATPPSLSPSPPCEAAALPTASLEQRAQEGQGNLSAVQARLTAARMWEEHARAQLQEVRVLLAGLGGLSVEVSVPPGLGGDADTQTTTGRAVASSSTPSAGDPSTPSSPAHAARTAANEVIDDLLERERYYREHMTAARAEADREEEALAEATQALAAAQEELAAQQEAAQQTQAAGAGAVSWADWAGVVAWGGQEGWGQGTETGQQAQAQQGWQWGVMGWQTEQEAGQGTGQSWEEGLGQQVLGGKAGMGRLGGAGEQMGAGADLPAQQAGKAPGATGAACDDENSKAKEKESKDQIWQAAKKARAAPVSAGETEAAATAPAPTPVGKQSGGAASNGDSAAKRKEFQEHVRRVAPVAKGKAAATAPAPPPAPVGKQSGGPASPKDPEAIRTEFQDGIWWVAKKAGVTGDRQPATREPAPEQPAAAAEKPVPQPAAAEPAPAPQPEPEPAEKLPWWMVADGDEDWSDDESFIPNIRPRKGR